MMSFEEAMTGNKTAPFVDLFVFVKLEGFP